MPLTDPQPDFDLLRRLREGDMAALSALYTKHSAPLYRFAVLQCGGADLAHDIVQETFLALMNAKGKFDPTQGSLGNYLFGVARNLSRRALEQSRRWVSNEHEDDAASNWADASPQPMERLLANETAEAVRAALATVPPHYREVVILYEMHDFSYAEAAGACGIDIGTVRSRLFRGRALLLKALNRAGLARPDTKMDAAMKQEA
ncbi:MAG: RNA polymerase sigma factor [Betaproteobacteria bacterium]|nr:RNA polymerase sigma factor [Betaproteobacteria bacterium]